ncbi:MAG: ATP-binding protein [Nitrospirota bacterium]
MEVRENEEKALFDNIVYRIDPSSNEAAHLKNRFYLLSGALIIVIFLMSAASKLFSRNNVFWTDTFTHSLFESYCGIISIIIAYVIYREYRSSGKRCNFYLFLGFVSMGVFDMFHAYSNHCTNLFVWFHSLSAFGGGLFFFLSSLSVARDNKDSPYIRQMMLITGITAIFAFALLLSKYPSPLPNVIEISASHHTPVTFPIRGEFTSSTIVFNVLSSVFFLLAGYFFLKYFNRTNDILFHIFALSSFLFFESEVLFSLSRLWDPSWWYWHVIKLVIFSGLIIGLAHGFTKSFDELQSSRKKLTDIVGQLRMAYENLKNTQSELLESEKLASVGKLAATIAHEIRNPLGAIKNSVGIFKRHTRLAGEDTELLDIIEQEVNRLNTIISDFLRFAKPPDLNRSYINLCSLIDETLSLLTSDGMNNPAITVQRSYDRGMPDIFADRGAVKQVFWNVLINSIQSMPMGGTLKVTALYVAKVEPYKQHDSVTIVITDTGSGMANETLARAFQPFYSTKAKGSGLGLSIVQQIIRQHGGQVYGLSEIGRGTELRIELPISPNTANNKTEEVNVVNTNSR